MVKRFLFFLSFVLLLLFFYRFLHPKEWHEIRLGASLPLSGINKELGREVYEGADIYFRMTNAIGGIRGKSIKLIALDDKYEPQKTLENTERLINEEDIFAFFGFVGTPTVKKVLPMILDQGIPFVAPYTGASFLRDSSFDTVVNFRSSYREEIENIISYLYHTKGIKRFGIFYQNDEYGIAGYTAALQALSKRGLQFVGEGSYRRNTLSIKHALYEIQQAHPEAILIIGAYKPSARFIKAWRREVSKRTLFAPISFVNANALTQELQEETSNIYFSLTVPSYDDKRLTVAEEYKALLKQYYPHSSPSYASFESFLAAKTVVIALSGIREGINRKAFLQKIKQLPQDAIGKIPLRYHQTQLLNHVYLSTFSDSAFHTLSTPKVKP